MTEANDNTPPEYNVAADFLHHAVRGATGAVADAVSIATNEPTDLLIAVLIISRSDGMVGGNVATMGDDTDGTCKTTMHAFQETAKALFAKAETEETKE